MENDEELKHSELMEGQEESEQMEGEGHDMQEMEGEGYDEGEFDDQQEEYQQQDLLPEDEGQYQQNTGIQFYPQQNQMINPAYGGALRPVSANVMKGANRKRFNQKDFNKDFDVRTRPKHFVKDKEGLYEDAIKFKKSNNNLKKENTKLKTTIRKLENELMAQQREMDEYIFNQNQGRLDFNQRYFKFPISQFPNSHFLKLP